MPAVGVKGQSIGAGKPRVARRWSRGCWAFLDCLLGTLSFKFLLGRDLNLERLLDEFFRIAERD
jgi:hypothetical protein